MICKAFDMPQGLDWRYVPAPMVQAGVGLFKGTDVLGRYLPNIKTSGSEFGLWGIGGKHDIKQWIPGVKKLPVLQLSLMYGYTKLHTNVGYRLNQTISDAMDNTTDISLGEPGNEIYCPEPYGKPAGCCQTSRDYFLWRCRFHSRPNPT